MTESVGRRRVATLGLGQEAAKRTLDVLVSLTAIIVLAPLMGLVWCLVRCTSVGPAVFRQERLGRKKQPFTLMKFRTMYVKNNDQIHREYVTSLLSNEQPSAGGQRGLYKLEKDPRITPVGGWLRRSSLDELPQLFNVLSGEMSLVGPRPVLPWEAQLFPEAYQRRFAVKPGITGLWQVSGRSRLSMRQALQLDVEYVLRRSLAFDISILFRTVPALFRGGAL